MPTKHLKLLDEITKKQHLLNRKLIETLVLDGNVLQLETQLRKLGKKLGFYFTEENHEVIRNAILSQKDGMITYILAELNASTILKLLRQDHYALISYAATFHHQEIFLRLITVENLLEELTLQAPKCNDILALYFAKFPSIDTLMKRRDQALQKDRNLVFDFTDEIDLAEYAYHYFCYLLTKPDAPNLDEIEFLYQLPCVKNRLHPKVKKTFTLEIQQKLALLFVKNDQLSLLDMLLERQALKEHRFIVTHHASQLMIEANARTNRSIYNRLLALPYGFAYAESHAAENEGNLYYFIHAILADVRRQYEGYQSSHNTSVYGFRLSKKQSVLCFYLIRYFIRSDSGDYEDDLNFLLEIGSVRDLLHKEITPNMPNELIRLAMSKGNHAIIQKLLSIPEVRNLAHQNRYYADEQTAGLDMHALIANTESAMSQLTQGEYKRLQAAIMHYQPSINSKGVSQVMDELRENIAEEYKKHPAEVEIKTDVSPLPLRWEDFQELQLPDEEYQQALKAYYRNKYHTAYRYLSIPNRWIKPNAAYSVMNDTRTESWANFEDDQRIISIFSLAARDEKVAAEDGYDHHARFDHFIGELAHMGRAHNWDNTRAVLDAKGDVVTDKHEELIREEYDDLEPDFPTCRMGIKRRLFQSVPHHPLLMMVTQETIKQEMIQFVRGHYLHLMSSGYQAHIKDNWEKSYTEDEPQQYTRALRKFNINKKDGKRFKQYLSQKYGDNFTLDLVQYVDKRFNLIEDGITYQSHFEKFYTSANLEQLLKRDISDKEVLVHLLKQGLDHYQRIVGDRFTLKVESQNRFFGGLFRKIRINRQTDARRISQQNLLRDVENGNRFSTADELRVRIKDEIETVHRQHHEGFVLFRLGKKLFTRSRLEEALKKTLVEEKRYRCTLNKS